MEQTFTAQIFATQTFTAQIFATQTVNDSFI
jgi:hypothetical protein